MKVMEEETRERKSGCRDHCTAYSKVIYVAHLCLASHKMDLDKQCKPRSDVTERGN